MSLDRPFILAVAILCVAESATFIHAQEETLEERWKRLEAEVESGDVEMVRRKAAAKKKAAELKADEMREKRKKQAFVIAEFIEVEQDVYSSWNFESDGKKSDDEFRKEVQKWVKAGDAKVLETATTTIANYQTGFVAGVAEYFYPTEYGPAVIPNEVENHTVSKVPVSAVTPAAYDRRDVGTSMTVSPKVDPTGQIALGISLIKTGQLKDEPVLETFEERALNPHMPRFVEAKTVSIANLTDGHYGFLGASPYHADLQSEAFEKSTLFMFVRVDVLTNERGN